ncbi:MAG: hypothetical protein AB7V27_04850 [Candidatus Binatia bacterium]
MMRRRIPLALVALLLLPFGSCTCRGHAPEVPPTPASRKAGWSIKPTPRAAPDRAEGETAHREAEAREAPTAIGTPNQSEIPVDFPEDIPVPEGSEVTAVQQLANGAHNVIFATEDETPKLFDLYKGNMSGKEWDVTQEYQGKEQSFLSFRKGDTITNVSITKDPKTGKKVVAVMYYEEEPLPFPEF